MNTKQSNREKYPEIAEFVDRLRELFGEVRVVRVVDNEPLNRLAEGESELK